MQTIRVAIRAADQETQAEVARELEALRGQEPSGAELIDDPAPRPRSLDPLLTTAAIALVVGVASGAGKKLGEVAMAWLIERIRGIAKKRQNKIIVSVSGVQLTVDEHTDPEQVAAQLAPAAGGAP